LKIRFGLRPDARGPRGAKPPLHDRPEFFVGQSQQLLFHTMGLPHRRQRTILVRAFLLHDSALATKPMTSPPFPKLPKTRISLHPKCLPRDTNVQSESRFYNIVEAFWQPFRLKSHQVAAIPVLLL
jgi:hypothetical protein